MMKTRAVLLTLVSLLVVGCSGHSQPEPATKPAPIAKAEAPPTPSAPANDNAAPANDDDPWAAPAGKKDPIAHPFFWSIEKDGKTSYALGTIHIGVDAELRLPEIVWQKLDGQPTFAMETDTTDASVTGMGSRKKGTIEQDLGPVYWKKLQELLTPQVANSINKMKPMIAAALLSLRGLPPTPPMDGVLLGRAMNKNKQLVYLEAAAKQAAILEKYMDVRMLKSMIDEGDKGTANTKEMLDAYLAGDDKKMIELDDKQRADSLKAGYTAKEYDTFMNEILYARNASWIAAIEKMHAAGGGFIAVGAAHLIGKKSVLEMLTAKGYKITRVSP